MLMANYGRMQGLIAVILLVLYVQPNCSGLMPNTDQPPKCTTVTRTNISEDPGCVGQIISEMFVDRGTTCRRWCWWCWRRRGSWALRSCCSGCCATGRRSWAWSRNGSG